MQKKINLQQSTLTATQKNFPILFNQFKKKTKKTIVYIFTWGSQDIFENEFDDLTNITIKSIPQPILEIYKSLMKNEE